MFFQDTQPPFGPTPDRTFRALLPRHDQQDLGQHQSALPARRFDWTILILYFTILGVLAVYGGYRVKQVIDFWRYRKFVPQPRARSAKQSCPSSRCSCRSSMRCMWSSGW